MRETKKVKDMTQIEADAEHVRCSKLINELYDDLHIWLHKRRAECEKRVKELTLLQEETFYGESATYMFYAEADEAVCMPDSKLVMELFKNNPGAIEIKIDKKKLTPEQLAMHDKCLHTVKKKAHVKFAKAPKLVFE
jgi:hypothetical protein